MPENVHFSGTIGGISRKLRVSRETGGSMAKNRKRKVKRRARTLRFDLRLLLFAMFPLFHVKHSYFDADLVNCARKMNVLRQLSAFLPVLSHHKR